MKKQDISHLPPEEQAKIEARRARNRDNNRRRALGLSKPPHRAPQHLSEAEKDEWRKQRRRESALECYYRNRDRYLANQRQRLIDDEEMRARRLAEAREWKKNNRERVNELNRIKGAEKRKDPFFRMLACLRSRVSNAMRAGKNRAGSAVRDLGCTYAELRVYLEERFLPGMTWENYGRRGWHIDHIIPLDLFDLTDRDQFLRAVHYTNLQPLWGGDNVRKSNKLPPPTLRF